MRQEREAGELPDRPAVGEEGETGRRVSHSRRGYAMGRRAFSAPGGPAATPTAGQIEMGALERRAVSGPTAAEASAQSGGPLRSPPADVHSRREWMRRRLDTLRGNERTVDEEEAERLRRLPRCESAILLETARAVDADPVGLGRKAIGTVFPGFR